MDKENIYQLFVRLLDGKTLTLRFTSEIVSGKTLTEHLYEITRIPSHHQFLLSQGRTVYPETLVSANENRLFPTVHLLLRLLGGKGGFGSLLRGAATKAGQKKTNNFDACRDMSGRRLRHVNAEKKLEEWRAEEEERKLEKVAEEYLKKKTKEVKKAGGSGGEEKYVAKYMEESARCVAEVEVAVREAMLAGNAKAKRKAVEKDAHDKKRLKIWLGKNKVGDSDSDSDDTDHEDSNEENAKSVVTYSKSHSDGSSSSVSGGILNGESSGGGGSCDSGSEEKKEIVMQGIFVGVDHDEANGVVEPSIHEETIVHSTHVSCLEAELISKTVVIEGEESHASKPETGNMEDVVRQRPDIIVTSEPNGISESKSEILEDKIIANTNNLDLKKPLNFDEYSSAGEMEVLGMERLKCELQTRGLKCGGTLQERAARLFMLKTTPFDKLPKKLLAKK